VVTAFVSSTIGVGFCSVVESPVAPVLGVVLDGVVSEVDGVVVVPEDFGVGVAVSGIFGGLTVPLGRVGLAVVAVAGALVVALGVWGVTGVAGVVAAGVWATVAVAWRAPTPVLLSAA
jgi:hypothetical protein